MLLLDYSILFFYFFLNASCLYCSDVSVFWFVCLFGGGCFVCFVVFFMKALLSHSCLPGCSFSVPLSENPIESLRAVATISSPHPSTHLPSHLIPSHPPSLPLLAPCCHGNKEVPFFSSPSLAHSVALPQSALGKSLLGSFRKDDYQDFNFGLFCLIGLLLSQLRCWVWGLLLL